MADPAKRAAFERYNRLDVALYRNATQIWCAEWYKAIGDRESCVRTYAHAHPGTPSRRWRKHRATSVCIVTLGGGGLRLLLVDAHGWARADQVSISMHVVDAADGGPELAVLDVGQREGRRLAAVGAVPV